MSFSTLEMKFVYLHPQVMSCISMSSYVDFSLTLRTANFPRRCALNDSLLSEYSTRSKTLNGKINRSKTCSTIRNLDLTGYGSV